MEKQINDFLLYRDINNEVIVEVYVKGETLWLTQKAIAELFGVKRPAITKHLKNIFNSNELDKMSVCSKMEHTAADNKTYLIDFYNLDAIIAVGYRVNSKNATLFRIWATKVLKEYLVAGYVENEKRLKQLEKRIKVIDIASRLDNKVLTEEAESILNVLLSYNKSLQMLDDYDHKKIKKPAGIESDKKITYQECINLINKMKLKENSNLFALERNKGLEGIIGAVYQTYNERDVYRTIEEKSANFLYLVVKNHVFIDGNKRIAAVLFIYFLNFYNILYQNKKPIISNNTLVVLTLFIAESNANEKDIIISLIMNFLKS